MTVGMLDVMTLAEFLRARIAEDEERASRTVYTIRDGSKVPYYNGPLDDDHGLGTVHHRTRPPEQMMYSDYLKQYAEAHPADPRMLIECEAKRRIVERCLDAMDSGADEDGNLMTSGAHLGEDVLRLLATPYADHGDRREEWAL